MHWVIGIQNLVPLCSLKWPTATPGHDLGAPGGKSAKQPVESERACSWAPIPTMVCEKPCWHRDPAGDTPGCTPRALKGSYAWLKPLPATVHEPSCWPREQLGGTLVCAPVEPGALYAQFPPLPAYEQACRHRDGGRGSHLCPRESKGPVLLASPSSYREQSPTSRDQVTLPSLPPGPDLQTSVLFIVFF